MGEVDSTMSSLGLATARRQLGASDKEPEHAGSLADIQAENTELKKMIESLQFFDNPDVMCESEKTIVRHVFTTVANAETLLVSEFVLLNDRLGTSIQKEDQSELLAAFGLTEDGPITCETFLSWYLNPDNRFVDSKKKGTAKFDLERADMAVRPSAEQFLLHKLRSHEINVFGTFEYRVAFSYQHQPISPWHDIPLFPHQAPSDEVHFICEIPKYTRNKFEIATGEYLNRIKQDVAHGVLREYKHGDMCFNYGALPQTWEDPQHFSEETQAKGDNDPLDAIEMGLTPMSTGEVKKVRVLGVLALIDSGETDWKIITLRVDDFLADKVHTLDELECVLPGAVGALREWLRVYKVCTGKPQNTFGFEGSCMNKEFAMKIIHENHEMWTTLVSQQPQEII